VTVSVNQFLFCTFTVCSFFALFTTIANVWRKFYSLQFIR